jgi:hypothetical protein
VLLTTFADTQPSIGSSPPETLLCPNRQAAVLCTGNPVPFIVIKVLEPEAGPYFGDSDNTSDEEYRL